MKLLATLFLFGCSLAAQPTSRYSPSADRATAQPEHMAITVEPVDQWYQSMFGQPRYGFTTFVWVADSHTDAVNTCITYTEPSLIAPVTTCMVGLRMSKIPGYVAGWFYLSNSKPTLISVRVTLMTIAGDTKEIRFDH